MDRGDSGDVSESFDPRFSIVEYKNDDNDVIVTQNEGTGTDMSWIQPNTRSTMAAATIVSIINEDSALIEIPNHIFGLQSYVVGATVCPADREVVRTGWIHIQRMSQKFSSLFRPTEIQFEEAVEFLREVVQAACNDYYIRVELAVVMYVNHHFVKPVATTDAEAIEFQTTVDTMTKACRRVRVSMTREKTSPRWINWYHLYQLLKGLWMDVPGNKLSPKNFVYNFLKEKRVKSPLITRTELAQIDKDFLDQLRPNRKSDPYQSPLQQRLAFTRNKKLYERLKNNTTKSTGLSFMVDRPRGKALSQNHKEPYHTWTEIQGVKLFYLYDQNIQETTVAAASPRKRDRLDDSLETLGSLQLAQSNLKTANLRSGLINERQEMQGTPSLECLVDMIETAYGRGAYFEYIRTRQSKTQEEHQALLGITFNQQMDNMAYYPPASEIFFNRGEQQRKEPSTLTGVSYADTTDDTLAGLEGMMAMAHGSPDYSSFHEHVAGLDDMVLSPTGCVDDFDPKGSDEKQPEKEENSGSETNRVGPAVSRTVPNQKVGLIENLSSETTDSEESNEVKEATTEANETPFQQEGINNVEKQSTKSPEQKSTTDKREIQGDGTREIEKSEGGPTDKVDSYHVKVPNYDIDSYEQSVGDNTTICTGCDNTIEKNTTMYTCRNCTNRHVLCLTCMTTQRMKH